MVHHVIQFVTKVKRAHENLLMMLQVKQLKLDVKIKVKQIIFGHTILNQFWNSLQVLCAYLAGIVFKIFKKKRF